MDTFHLKQHEIAMPKEEMHGFSKPEKICEIFAQIHLLVGGGSQVMQSPKPSGSQVPCGASQKYASQSQSYKKKPSYYNFPPLKLRPIIWKISPVMKLTNINARCHI